MNTTFSKFAIVSKRLFNILTVPNQNIFHLYKLIA